MRLRFPAAVASSLQAGKPPQYFTRPTQPPTLSGTGNDHQPKCGDAVQLGSKGRYGSFHLWINVWVAGKTCVIFCYHVPCLSALEMSHDKALYKSTVTLTLIRGRGGLLLVLDGQQADDVIVQASSRCRWHAVQKSSTRTRMIPSISSTSNSSPSLSSTSATKLLRRTSRKECESGLWRSFSGEVSVSVKDIASFAQLTSV